MSHTHVFPRVFLPFMAGCLVLLLNPAAHASDLRDKPSTERAGSSAGETLRPFSVNPGLAGSFLSSRFAGHHEAPKEAAKYLADALKYDPNNEHLLMEALRANVLAGNMSDAFNYANKLAGNAKNDPLIATILTLEEIKLNDYPKAVGWAKVAPEIGLFGVIRPVMLEWLAIGSGEVKGAADMQAAVDKSGFFAPFLTYHMALMNDVLGNEPLARSAYLKASADPSITPYRVVEALANFYARHKQWDKAQATYDSYAKANPDSSLIPDKLVSTDAAVAPMVANAKDGMAELFFTTASILFGEEATQDTFLYLRIALELKPDLPPAQLMLANLYEQSGDYAEAISTYDGIATGSVFYRRGQIRKALNLEALDKKKEAVDLLEKIAAGNPSDNTALITKGDMLREQEKYDEAIAAYSEAIKRTAPLKASDWPLLYARAISFERSGNWDKAEADFLAALKLEPNQPDVLNYLAYSWLTMNRNVNKARDYLEIAISARPDDAHIIDSAGWAEYITGNFQKSVEYFEKAVDIMPDDPTVNDHLGDAYWRVGRTIEAKYQWQRALGAKPDDQDMVHALQQKLEKGLPPASGKQSDMVKSSDETKMAAPGPGVPASMTQVQ